MAGAPHAGITPASAFTENAHADPAAPPAILADAIDPATRDFLSLERGLDPVDAAMVFTFGVRRGSGAAVQGVGHRLPTARHADPEAVTLLQSLAREAAKHLTDAGVVRLGAVGVTIENDAATVSVNFENLPARRPGLTVVPQ